MIKDHKTLFSTSHAEARAEKESLVGHLTKHGLNSYLTFL